MNKAYDMFSGLLAGVVIGAAAVFLLDEKNRKKIQATAEDWKQRGTDEIEDLKDKAEDLREKGIDAVSHELSKAKSKVEKSRR